MNPLEKLRNKPPHEKAKLLWIAVAVTSFVLIIIWLIAIPKDYLHNDQENPMVISELKGEIQDSISDRSYENLQDNFDEIKNVKDGDSLQKFVSDNEENYNSELTLSESEEKLPNRLPIEN